MPSLNYDSCGILTRTDIRSVRYVEEGYTTDDLDALCSRIGELTDEATEDGTGYLNIPPALHMWNADELYYTQIAGVELYPELSQSRFNDDPYTGNTFVDLWQAFDGSSGTLDDWDADEYLEPSTCQEVVEYEPGFMRSPIPSIQFIVDTASVSITKVNTSITTVIESTSFVNSVIDLINTYSSRISAKVGGCIKLEPVASGEEEISWDKCCFDISDFLELHGFGTFLEALPTCETAQKVHQYIGAPSCPGGYDPAIALLTKTEYGTSFNYSEITYLCPPAAVEGKTWALTWNGTDYSWMEIASCEEAEPEA